MRAAPQNFTVVVITAIIGTLVFLIAALLLSSIFRRVWNSRKYRALDRLRDDFRQRVQSMLAPDGSTDLPWAAIAPGSLAGVALEQVLLEFMERGGHEEALTALYCRLGFAAFHEERLTRRNAMTRAAAADKLGKMRCSASLSKLIPLLDGTEPEVLAVTVRALSRIGAIEGLNAIIARLHRLLGLSLVTRKAMDTSLTNFGDAAIPYLIGFRDAAADAAADPWVLSCVLETLSHLSPDVRSTAFASPLLASPNAEVRSKALKVLGRTGVVIDDATAVDVLRTLEDQSWFVRIQGIRTALVVARDRAAEPFEKLLFDANWAVRNEAAAALMSYGDGALQFVSDALASTDRYAKESICEELQRTGFSDVLLANLGNANDRVRTLSATILRTMHELQFSTPLHEYMARGSDEGIKDTVRGMLLPAGVRA